MLLIKVLFNITVTDKQYYMDRCYG